MELSSAVGKQLGESVADLSLIVEVKLAELVEGGVVVLYRRMRGLEVQLGHGFGLLGKERQSLASLREPLGDREGTGLALVDQRRVHFRQQVLRFAQDDNSKKRK